MLITGNQSIQVASLIRCSGVMAGLVAAVFFFIVLAASPVQCHRPEPLRGGVRLTYASSNDAAAINSTALLDESKDRDLVFCNKHACDDLPTCYCCESNPNPERCYSTRRQCRANCPVRKTERSH